MPFWLFLYFAVIATVVTMGVRDDWGKPGELPHILGEVMAASVLVLCAASFWLSPLRVALGSATTLLFTGSLAWLVVGTVRELHRMSPRPSAVAAAGGVALFLVLYTPMIYWGFVSAFHLPQNGA